MQNKSTEYHAATCSANPGSDCSCVTDYVNDAVKEADEYAHAIRVIAARRVKQIAAQLNRPINGEEENIVHSECTNSLFRFVNFGFTNVVTEKEIIAAAKNSAIAVVDCVFEEMGRAGLIDELIGGDPCWSIVLDSRAWKEGAHANPEYAKARLDAFNLAVKRRLSEILSQKEDK